MRKRRIQKLEDTIKQELGNTVVLWDGIDKGFTYNDKEYTTKEQLEKDYQNIKFDYITIVWEDGNIPIEKQTDKRVIDTLQEFEANY